MSPRTPTPRHRSRSRILRLHLVLLATLLTITCASSTASSQEQDPCKARVIRDLPCEVCVSEEVASECTRRQKVDAENQRLRSERDQAEGAAKASAARAREAETRAGELLQQKVDAETRARTAEKKLAELPARPWQKPVGWTLLTLALVWGVTEALVDESPDWRQLAGAGGAALLGAGFVLIEF